MSSPPSPSSPPPPQPAPTAPSSIYLPPLLVFLTVLLPLLLLTSSHSGSPLSPHTNPLTNGDYEAHRKWSSYHTIPLSKWYSHDLDYWGLDYPPFAAWLHVGLGRIMEVVDPKHTDMEVKVRRTGHGMSM